MTTRGKEQGMKRMLAVGAVVAASVDRLGEFEANPLIVGAGGVIAIGARGMLD